MMQNETFWGEKREIQRKGRGRDKKNTERKETKKLKKKIENRKIRRKELKEFNSKQQNFISKSRSVNILVYFNLIS